MVGPIPEAERAAFTRKLKVGVALLVGLSASLTALQTGASLPLAGGSLLAGTAVGWALSRFAVPAGPSPAERQRRRLDAARENPFADSGAADRDEEAAEAPRRNS